MKLLFATVALTLIALPVLADGALCTGIHDWPAVSSLAQLEEAKIADPAAVDLAKSAVIRVVSERLRNGYFRQVHRIRFARLSGPVLEVLTVSNASATECGKSSVATYVVSERLGLGDGLPPN